MRSVGGSRDVSRAAAAWYPRRHGISHGTACRSFPHCTSYEAHGVVAKGSQRRAGAPRHIPRRHGIPHCHVRSRRTPLRGAALRDLLPTRSARERARRARSAPCSPPPSPHGYSETARESGYLPTASSRAGHISQPAVADSALRQQRSAGAPNPEAQVLTQRCRASGSRRAQSERRDRISSDRRVSQATRPCASVRAGCSRALPAVLLRVVVLYTVDCRQRGMIQDSVAEAFLSRLLRHGPTAMRTDRPSSRRATARLRVAAVPVGSKQRAAMRECGRRRRDTADAPCL